MEIEYVKIYGERNSGTNVLQHAIDLNFACRMLPGIARFGEEAIAAHLDELGLAGHERDLFREYLIDDAIAQHLGDDLGWKHAAPPLETIRIYTRLQRTLFVVITKDPYNWLLSFHKRPYHKLYSAEPDFSGFIRHYWISARRENLVWNILKNPMHLYMAKIYSYQHLQDLGCHFLHVRYQDFLENFDGVMESIGGFLPRKQPGDWVLPLGSLKNDEKNFYDYQRQYRDDARIRAIGQEDLVYIDQHLDWAVLEKWGYRPLA